jgi:hypothetical protein
MSNDNLRKAEDVLLPPDTMAAELMRLLPEVQERMKQLPPEFPADVVAPVLGAELMFRGQGGCGAVISVFTTEDGIFLSPVPDNVGSYGEIVGHMRALLDGKPGAKAVAFSFAAKNAGPGAAKGAGSLVVDYLTPACLYRMSAPITGARSLGRWQLEVIYP